MKKARVENKIIFQKNWFRGLTKRLSKTYIIEELISVAVGLAMMR